jgi:hypothetical protein
MILRRNLFLGSAAVILTPGVLMPLLPDRLVYVPFDYYATHAIKDGTFTILPGGPLAHLAKYTERIVGRKEFSGVWISPRHARIVGLHEANLAKPRAALWSELSMR